MNVMYIGVDNPLRIAAANVPMNEIVVKLVGDGQVTGEQGNYTAQVKMPGTVTIEVYRRLKDGDYLMSATPFRVKRIPDPKPGLNGLNIKTGIINVDSLKNPMKVALILENFIFDVACEVTSYEITILPKRQDPITYYNNSGKMREDIKAAIAGLGVGSVICIDDIKGLCPGDAAPRNVGGIAFKIK